MMPDPVAALARDMRTCVVCRRDLLKKIDRAKAAVDRAVDGAPPDATDEAIVVESIAAARTAGLCAAHAARYVSVVVQVAKESVN
jgi:hypothetical protein